MLQSSKLSNRFKNSIKEQNVESQITAENIEESEKKYSLDISNLESEYKKSLLLKIETIPVWFDYSSDKQKELIYSFVTNKLSVEGKEISDFEKNELVEKLYSSIMGFGPLDYLISKDNINSIFVNGFDGVHIEINGKILDTEIKLSQIQLDFILKNIVCLSENKPDTNSYIWHCKLKNLNISVILPPVVVSGANITIKKTNLSDLDMRVLVDNKFLNKDIFDFLSTLVNSKKNIIISGEIDSGKTLLVDTLLSSSLCAKRGILLEEFPQILSKSQNLMKFNSSYLKSGYDFEMLFSNILKMQSEYLIIDSNNPYYFNSCVAAISEEQGAILTLRSVAVDSAMSKVMAAYMAKEKYNEKLAKSKFLSTFDYIVQINKCQDGIKRITSILELTQAKSAALCTKVIANWEDNHYEMDIPQPFTTIKADSLIVQPKIGSMRERFCPKNN